MKKVEIIKEMCQVQNMHSKEDLEKMKINELRKLAKDFGIKTSGKPAPKKEPEKTPPKEKPKDLKPVETPPKEEPKFKSFCGFDFDPNKTSTCNTDCKTDNPDEYAACLENFKNKPAKKATKRASKAKSELNAFGHRKDTQGGKVDECLLDKDPMSVKDIAIFAECTEARVKRHFKKLIYLEAGRRDDENGKNKGDVYITKDGLCFLPIRFPEMEGVLGYKMGKPAYGAMNKEIHLKSKGAWG